MIVYGRYMLIIRFAGTFRRTLAGCDDDLLELHRYRNRLRMADSAIGDTRIIDLRERRYVTRLDIRQAYQDEDSR
jgi:hypothetical protein